MNRLTRSEQTASWLIGLGIVLVLIGWRGYRYFPMTPEEAFQEEALQLVVSFQRQALPEVPEEWRESFQQNLETLEKSSLRYRKEKPFRTLGIVGLALGGLCLLLGGILWTRSRPAGAKWIRSNDDA
jgi:hypothetical protein